MFKPLIQGMVALICLSAADAATIDTPEFTSVPNSTPPHYNLTTLGSQDWALYSGDTGYLYSPEPSSRKLGGVSIAESVQVTAPCTLESADRVSQTFSWLDGGPDLVGNENDPRDNGFRHNNSTTAAYGDNSQTYTFMPGDTLPHTVHLYGYAANSNSGISFRFSVSLAGAAPQVLVISPPLGNFDFSVTFQADNPDDVLTVVWTFQKTGGTGTLKSMGINAVAMSGTKPASAVNWRVVADDPAYPSTDVLVRG
ncbi:MAG: hypothetical protein HC888_19440 [Candidatus Competibacteraceae bacterium]|nr:hypothetical protein [Candidatus Competibacteraceae bacterium]